MKIGDSVELIFAEQRLSRFMATSRTQANRDAGRTASVWHEDNDLLGFAGELAFCKMANVYPDLTIGERPSYDAVMPDGSTVDVKTTDLAAGRLLVLPWKSELNPPDWYALVTGTFPRFTYRGVMSAVELFQTPLRNLGKGETYAVDQRELYEWREAGVLTA